MVVGYLPEREKRSDEQQAGHRQHGGCLLHAAGGHGPQPAGLRLGTSALLEAAALGPQVAQAGLPVGHQQGERATWLLISVFRAVLELLLQMKICIDLLGKGLNERVIGRVKQQLCLLSYFDVNYPARLFCFA